MSVESTPVVATLLVTCTACQWIQLIIVDLTQWDNSNAIESGLTHACKADVLHHSCEELLHVMYVDSTSKLNEMVVAALFLGNIPGREDRPRQAH